MARSRRVSSCWAAGLFLLSAGAGAQLPRLGAEFQVNSYTSSFQHYASIASETDGDFVVVWHSNQDGGEYGVFGRRFTSAGTPLANEFQVNTYTPGWQRFPAVASSGSGNFTVVWTSADQDGSGLGVFARNFSGTGAPLATEFQVNAYTPLDQFQPAVFVEGGGAATFAWTSDGRDGSGFGVFARSFNLNTPSGAEFQLNSYTPGAQSGPSLAANLNGTFVVAWQSALQDGGNYGIFAQRFYAGGTLTSGEFQATDSTASDQRAPSVARKPFGDFVVTWQSNSGGNYDIFAKRFDSQGYSVAKEFQVNTYTSGIQRAPSLALDPGGAFVVTWQSDTQDGNLFGVFARRFTSAGDPSIAEFQVNTYTSNTQIFPTVAAGGGGKYVVAWSSNPQDGSNAGIFGQRLGFLSALDIDGNGSVSPLTDGLLALRYSFGFRGDTLITGAVGAGCTRCNAFTIEPYLASLVN